MKSLDLTQPAEMLAYIPQQTAPFVINGDAEVLQAMYDEQPKESMIARMAQSAVQAVQRAERPKPVQFTSVPLEGRTAAIHGLKARLFDMRHGTSVYDELQERRLQERRLRIRQSLGLISSTHCAKHERALKEGGR